MRHCHTSCFGLTGPLSSSLALSDRRHHHYSLFVIFRHSSRCPLCRLEHEHLQHWVLVLGFLLRLQRH